jgi:magnesium transporter
MIRYLICKDGFHELKIGDSQTKEYSDDVWVNVVHPNHQDIEILKHEFGVPVSFLNDIEDDEERPRIEHEGDWRMIIIRVPIKTRKTGDFFETVPLGILTSGETFITVCHHSAEMLDDFVLYSIRKSLSIKNANDLALHLMLSSSVWFMKYMKRLSAKIDEAETLLQKSIRNEDLLEMMRIEHTLVHFITSLRSNELLLTKFKTILSETKQSFDEDLLEDVEIELHQAQTTAGVYSDILTAMMDAFGSIISNNVNTIMKRLTSVSIVLMVPTLVASYFGMNLEKSSEIWTVEFFSVITASMIVAMISVVFFRRKSWL